MGSRQRVAIVTTLGRRAAPLSEYPDAGASPKLVQKIVGVLGCIFLIADFEHLSQADFAGHDVVFCALGTTRKDAGSAVRCPPTLFFAPPALSLYLSCSSALRVP
jgi:hypothetical protein